MECFGSRHRPPSRHSPESRSEPAMRIVPTVRFPTLSYPQAAMRMHRPRHTGIVHRENSVADGIPVPTPDRLLNSGSLGTSDRCASGFLRGESCTIRFAFRNPAVRHRTMETMTRTIFFCGAACLLMCLWSNAPATEAQGIKAAPRPPAQTGTPPGESATPDGYAPIPAWLGQTRAPRPIKTAEYSVETVAEGLNGAFSFNFLPDGRMIAAERAGHIRVIGKDGKLSEIEGLPSNLWARGQGSSKSGRIAPSHRTGRSTLLTRFFLTVRNPMPCRGVPPSLLYPAQNYRLTTSGEIGDRELFGLREVAHCPRIPNQIGNESVGRFTLPDTAATICNCFAQ